MLKQRIITAIILAVVIIGAIVLLPANGFYVLVAGIFAVAAWEWAQLADIVHPQQRIIYALMVLLSGVWASVDLGILNGFVDYDFEPVLMANIAMWFVLLGFVVKYPRKTSLWSRPWVRALLGAVLLVLTALSLCYIRQQEHWLAMIIYTILVVVCADTGAYFAGVNFGKRKLLPAVSPGKTWEGFAGGLLANFVLAIAASKMIDDVNVALLIFVTFAASLLSVLGDLTESMFKRNAGVKDSSRLLPGHGGVLDRIDSVMAAAPVIAYGVLLSKSLL